MKILIVEPHFDDGCLNLGGYMLLNPNNIFYILTLTNHPTNKEDGTIILSKFFSNISGNFLGYKSLGFDDNTIKQAIKDYKTKNYTKLFLKLNKLESLKPIKEKIKNECKNFDKIFWPLGIKHPQHIVMNKLKPINKKIILYREYPYFLYKDQKKIIKQKIINKKEIKINIEKVLNRKIELFKKVYPKQSFILKLKINNKEFKNIKDEVFWKNN